MWKIKTFKSDELRNKWIADNRHKYQTEVIFINNGYAVEYKKLRKVY